MNEHKLKEQICEIGRRLYAKGFAAANDGNITVRLNEREVLCTPTMVSKGFSSPRTSAKSITKASSWPARKKRTSEVLLHLAVYKQRPDVDAVRPLPSAARHRLRRRPRADPQVRAARGRGLPRRSAHRRVRDARRRRSSPTRVVPYRQAIATRSFSPTTAPSRSAPTWRRPTSTPKSSTPIARS